MRPRIVVGIDGSSGAREALRWAREHARERGATLDAVHTWEYPQTVPLPGGPVRRRAEYFEAAQQALDDVLRDEGIDADEVHATATLVEGPAGPMLTEAAKGADLLVVGSRGLGGFGGLLLGSVSQYCLHHAPCPVVVVRPGAAGKAA